MTRSLHILGLCRKAGKLEVGEAPAHIAVKAGICRVLIIAGDASAGTASRSRYLCEVNACAAVTIPADKKTLGALVGRESVALAAITDPGLAASFLRAAESEGVGPFPELLEKLDAQRDRKPKKPNRRKRR